LASYHSSFPDFGITIGAFNIAKTRSETVIIAFVILTYQHSQERLMGLGVGMIAGIGMLRDDTKRIRELLKEEMTEDAASREKEEKPNYTKNSNSARK
jgi:hypothetical protein